MSQVHKVNQDLQVEMVILGALAKMGEMELRERLGTPVLLDSLEHQANKAMLDSLENEGRMVCRVVMEILVEMEIPVHLETGALQGPQGSQV